MAIVHLGAKRLQGTKVDRVLDSLGSSADGSNTGITLLSQNLNFNSSSSDNAIVYDLGSGNVSDTQWVLRFELDLTQYDSSNSSSDAVAIGIASADQATITGSQSGIGLEIGCGTSDTEYRMALANSATWVRGTKYSIFTRTPKAEKIYVEIKRTSGTEVVITQYEDSGFSTSLESKTNNSNVSGISGLRYWFNKHFQILELNKFYKWNT